MNPLNPRQWLTLLGAPAIIILVATAWLLFLPVVAHGASCSGQWMKASWYGMETCRGKSRCLTADGTRFNGEQMLVAHRSMPFGTKLRITYGGKSVVAVVRDRGPAKWTGKDIDLSRAVAAKIGLIAAGVGTVCVERL